ncbi:MAG: DUF2157 domain-containing protein [Planctomycetota bacterium]|nr:MAG: DUF2157 domain-containing protein [Planctomycetota bacterium]
MTLMHQRWLAEQLPEWERDGIITAAGARLLRERYPVEPRGGLAQMIVGAVGALLVGTGLIAVLAYNWDDFPRWVRLGLALGPLAASQAASWWVLGRGESAKPWMRESAALVQTLAVGAAMALVSQIYNLPGTWTDLVFWWCLVAVPLAWVFRSDAVAIAYLIGIAVWTVAQAEAHGSWFSRGDVADVRIWFPLLLSGILPRWPGPNLHDRPQPGSRLVLAGSVLVGLLAVAAYAGIRPREPNNASFWLAMLSGAAVLLFPLERSGIEEPLSRKPQVLLGGCTVLGLALIATYEDPARELVKSVGFGLPLGWCWLLLAVVAGFAILAYRQGRFAELAIAAVALVPLLAAPLSAPDASGWPVAIASSLVLLATAIALIALEFIGYRGAARIGAALITLLVILRMADAGVSLLVKGLAFIVIGSGFLGFNAFVSRRRAAAPGGTPA